ncbi:MAG: TOBE domain-containing protein [Halobacteriota archaeon]
MKISVRNKIPATIKEVKLGAIMAEIVLQAGNNKIVAAITKDAVEDLVLKVGDDVTALVKSTSVMIQK